jgi:hypothetical protein
MQKSARSKGVRIHTYSGRVSAFCSRQFFVFQTLVMMLKQKNFVKSPALCEWFGIFERSSEVRER